ncbi:MAG: alanyl-tRNA editing protein, partial [Wenzhouxiangellaceae bacterium]
MTEMLHQFDAYLKTAPASVVESSDAGIVLDKTIFYALGGGQPGDTGMLRWTGGETAIVTPIVDTRYRREDGEILHLPAEGAELPPVGAQVEACIDWEQRHRHMRMHTCLHLLGAVLKFPVTGGQVGADKSRLDFDMPDPPDKDEINRQLNSLIEADHPVT